MIRIPKYFVTSITLLALLVVFAQTSHAKTATEQVNVPESGNSSLNWSGYVADQSTNGYTSVIGTWSVPSVSATTTGTADASWVGIGGVKTRDLIQAGTQAIVDNGAVTYSAWIEMLPGFSKTVPLTVASRDSITASITEESPASWLITISNNTRGTNYSRTAVYDSSKTSAEWVEEMVSNGNGTFRPLDSFGSIGFTNAAATTDGQSQNLLQLGATPLKMVNISSNQILATPSVLGSDSQSFSVARSNASAVVVEDQSTVPMVTRVRHRRHSYSGTYSFGGIPVTVTIIGL